MNSFRLAKVSAITCWKEVSPREFRISDTFLDSLVDDRDNPHGAVCQVAAPELSHHAEYFHVVLFDGLADFVRVEEVYQDRELVGGELVNEGAQLRVGGLSGGGRMEFREGSQQNRSQLG